jgi:hypothetical protein
MDLSQILCTCVCTMAQVLGTVCQRCILNKLIVTSYIRIDEASAPNVTFMFHMWTHKHMLVCGSCSTDNEDCYLLGCDTAQFGKSPSKESIKKQAELCGLPMDHMAHIPEGNTTLSQFTVLKPVCCSFSKVMNYPMLWNKNCHFQHVNKCQLESL